MCLLAACILKYRKGIQLVNNGKSIAKVVAPQKIHGDDKLVLGLNFLKLKTCGYLAIKNISLQFMCLLSSFYFVFTSVTLTLYKISLKKAK